MLEYDLITDPAHYVADRVIQPITLIENWNLCHHLACVVKYIARYERKNNPFQDLQKAKWYLMRELNRSLQGLNRCQGRLIDLKSITPEEVAVDWALNPWLYQVLIDLKMAHEGKKKIDNLCGSLQSLRDAMNLYRG